MTLTRDEAITLFEKHAGRFKAINLELYNRAAWFCDLVDPNTDEIVGSVSLDAKGRRDPVVDWLL